jgi:hypothetical protein
LRTPIEGDAVSSLFALTRRFSALDGAKQEKNALFQARGSMLRLIDRIV